MRAGTIPSKKKSGVVWQPTLTERLGRQISVHKLIRRPIRQSGELPELPSFIRIVHFTNGLAQEIKINQGGRPPGPSARGVKTPINTYELDIEWLEILSRAR